VPFVDSNAFVYHLVADPADGRKAKRILENIEAGERCAARAQSDSGDFFRMRKKEGLRVCLSEVSGY